MTTRAMTSVYALDNRHADAPMHHDALSVMFDPFTTGRITDLLALNGKRCLEVGAGGGSIALWLAERVGPFGRVLATDLAPQLIPSNHRLQVLRHDLATEPLPEGPWDLVHARLVLSHMPNRHQILQDMTARLAPDGILLVEDWTPRLDAVLVAPDQDTERLYLHFQEAVSRVFATAGSDRAWGRQIHQAMLDAGLLDVQTVIHAESWPGGTAGARLMQATVEQLRPQLLTTGQSEEQLARVQTLLDDPGLILQGHPMYSTCGRSPG
ncbi:class I SAM-dependent methyltransferase [Rugosimonospora africana]|uniref:Methyltransferase n=1 Tax=Rugosimonospora africana TaxID=556532 RepID=A0A8J3VRD7_9ACTN|nr:class I SAM-dependent methyltransferase [Rugosimonospora africana]GIH16075.1 methyltransferase [Rugosimonospora africana]